MDMVAFKALAAAVRPMIAQGTSRFLITSSGPQEGKSTVAANLSRALASSGKYSVALVDADLLRPTLHQNFRMEQRRGLTELMTELYHANLSREQPSSLGLGDWIELLRAQVRTGELKISSADEDFSITFVKGRISSIRARNPDGSARLGSILVGSGKISEEQRDAALLLQKEGSRRIGEVLHGLDYIEATDVESALLAQVRSSLHQLVSMTSPKFTFTESPHGHAPGAPHPGAEAEDATIDRFVAERFGDYLKHPFLSDRIPNYLADTEIENLKLLTRGEAEYDITESAFQVFLERLAKMFDVVIIDSPPVAATSPAVTLALMAQGVLFVVKSEGFDVRIVQQAKDHLLASGANLVGVVLNQVNVKNDPYVAYYYGAYRR